MNSKSEVRRQKAEGAGWVCFILHPSAFILGCALAASAALAQSYPTRPVRVVVGFGAVDILVNNAGIQFVSPIEEFPPEKWDAIIAINLVALFHTIRHAVPGGAGFCPNCWSSGGPPLRDDEIGAGD